MANDIDQLVATMMAGKYVPSREFRKAIDREPKIRQRIALSKEYKGKLQEFYDAIGKAKDAGSSRFKLGGAEEGSPSATFDTTVSEKVKGSLQNRAGPKGRANFRQINSTLKSLDPELMDGMELGHSNISILRSSLASLLKVMPGDDRRREALVALYATVDSIDKITDKGEATLENVLQTLEAAAEEGFSVKGSITKDVNILKGTEGSISLEIENKGLNQLKGRLAARMGLVFKQVVEGNLGSFEKLFEDVDITNIQGSPTIREDVTEGLVEVIDPKRKIRRRKSTDNSKVHKGGAPAGKLKRPKKKKIRKPNLQVSRQKGPGSAPLALLGILNQQLPERVRRNMNSPRLVNRTGRFAGSVKITDMSVTAQGFPSIGYTYQREIYETFELGNRQGSVDRDPRRLIDQSIREIASQFAIGRFYTRRS